MGRHSDRKRSRSRSPVGSTSRSRRRSKSPRDREDRDRHRSRKHRSRSRSPRDGRRDGGSSKYRSRSRSPDRHRSNRDKDRSNGTRSRSPSYHRSRRSSGSPDRINRERVEDIIGRNVTYKNFDIDEQQKHLERKIQERRERVEEWRKSQKQTADLFTIGTADTVPLEDDSGSNVQLEESVAAANCAQKKKWTLGDDDGLGDGDDDEDEENGVVPMDDDEDESITLKIPQRVVEDEDKIEKVVAGDKSRDKAQKAAEVTLVAKSVTTQPEMGNLPQAIPAAEPAAVEEEEEDDDVDPLDAFMLGIQEQVKKYRTQTLSKNENGDQKVTVVVGVAKKKTERKRGELMEQNQDALEYSSSDEVEKGDDLANAMDNLQAKTKQKKPLTISIDDISYIPFRKNFYIEVPEITRMTTEEVEAYKTEMEGIKTKGKGCPRPIKTWAQCGVSKKVLDILKKNNFEKPTPIQCQAIPAVMSGRDLIGIAKTGSGKTLAFLIPMFRHILDQPRLESGDGPIAIIMTPTRELATQIYGQCRKFTKYLSHTGRGEAAQGGGKDTRLRVVAVYGGTPISEQIGDLKPGAEIVVCTPGRMIDMLAANSGRVTNLRRCSYVVLDEADRMFDMGFEPQVMRIIDGIRPDRQTVMFSATFPRIMEALARRILDKPIEVQVGGRSVVCKEVEQNVVVIPDDDKFLKLLQILGKFATQGSAICFVDKQEHADMLLKELMHASYTCLALHGGIDQNDRDSTMSDFKNGKVNVLVATSVAARGLDVKHCIVVINYDCPNHYEDYVHRCGRTGRAGNKGYAYTFITPEQGRYATDLIKALEQSGNPIPEDLQKLFDDYKREQELLGKKVKSSSGFSGKGFKFDEAEAQQAIEKKRIQKAALGLNDSDDEDPDADIDAEIDNLLSGAPKKKAFTAAPPTTAAPATTGTTTTTGTTSVPPTSAPGVPGPEKSMAERMEMVRKMASMITRNLNPAAAASFSKTSATAHTEAILKGDANSLCDFASAVNAKSIAEQRAESIHAKLNYIPRDSEYNENGDLVRRETEDFTTDGTPTNTHQRYEQELEINDFPQQARWRVTSKEAIAMISEYSEAGITVRGTFFPPGKDPGLGERKLFLAIEGTNEMAVSKAQAEIKRLIKEELLKLQSSNQQFNKGRYKVL